MVQLILVSATLATSSGAGTMVNRNERTDPVVVAAALWGNLWRGKIVLVHCDNQAVVEVVSAGYSKDPLLMQLLQCLFFIMAYFEITVRANHIQEN